ncbi:ATP-dependent helicase dcl2 [Xylogone sp. PMI_703]|nr:ATP-dependent helicase dcl2 [Xylogone sp. PMI_703]
MKLPESASHPAAPPAGGIKGGVVNAKMIDEPGDKIPIETSRAYQLEMYEASMRGNVIVVMDTGSGKTHVAKLRIQAELERCPVHKLVWFLAPSVPLCEQQHSTLKKALPTYPIRLLIGSDNVDRWLSKKIWDDVLEDVRIVVSTHAILADALSFGFVRMDRLALLIFDEAHHCVRNHPANAIMRDHYHPYLENHGADSVPSILGLTASPAIRSKPKDVELVERNLNARCHTPRIHRTELLEFVHRPHFVKLEYDIAVPKTSSLGHKLTAIFSNALKWTSSEDRPRASELDQLRKFVDSASYIQDELGTWAAGYYIKESVKSYIWTWTQSRSSVAFLKLIEPLAQSEACSGITVSDTIDISPKVEELIRFLEKQDQSRLYGIIFVDRRATVAVLQQVLSMHPRTQDILRCGTFVGSSNSTSKKNQLGDWLNPTSQVNTLDEFRGNSKNIIISTNVLEEGIDVSACNLVVCFNPPVKLTSFIQRRGRARKDESVFVLMTERNETNLKDWARLEQEIALTYAKEMEQLKELKDIENALEYSDMRLYIEQTGALVTFLNVMARIHHFCTSLLNPQPYVELKPRFHIQDDPESGLVSAVIVLPDCIDSSVRTARSKRKWKTEKMAKRDAAFHAYVALYKKELVNEYLLPAMSRGQAIEELMDGMETRDATIKASECLDPWRSIAIKWSATEHQLHQKLITIDRPGRTAVSFLVVLPTHIPDIPSFRLYVDDKTTYEVSFNGSVIGTSCYPDLIILRQATATILQSASAARMKKDSDLDFIALFLPFIDQSKLLQWLEDNTGSLPATEALTKAMEQPLGIIRDMSHYGATSTFHKMIGHDTIEVIPLSKRRDFLHRISHKHLDNIDEGDVEEEPEGPAPKIKVISVHTAMVDKLSLDYAECSRLIPSITHRLGRYFLALDLHNSILCNVGFSDINYIIAATNAPSAREGTDYEELEFVGDVVLKFLATVNLYISRPLWPEGFLSRAKDKIVSNARLSRAAMETGLDKYIFTKIFTARKWRPAYISDYGEPDEVIERQISTKTLADVVEALIGGAYMEGGVDKALRCARSFLPNDIAEDTPAQLLNSDIRVRDEIITANSTTSKIEELIGYEFKAKRILVEAIIHPSHQRDITTDSYQRLEFLGDSALDMVVIAYIAEHAPDIPYNQMHLIKTAMVNTGYLAYICMDTSMDMPDTVKVVPVSGKRFETVQSTRKVRLCDFMLHNLVSVMQTSLERYEALKPKIQEAISHGALYPWVELAAFVPEKFLADMIESIIGAVLVDTVGDLTACTRVVEKLGMLKFLQRMIAGEVDLLHPKSMLGELVSSQGRKVKFNVTKDEYTGNTSCTVLIDGIEMMTVEGCGAKEEATALAASMTLERIMNTNVADVEMNTDDAMIVESETEE